VSRTANLDHFAEAADGFLRCKSCAFDLDAVLDHGHRAGCEYGPPLPDPAWRLVVVESPHAPPADASPRDRYLASARHRAYLAAALADCLGRGEAPFASHAIYTLPNVLDDTIPAERARGIAAGLAWARVAWRRVLYLDLGCSRGMYEGMVDSFKRAHPGHDRGRPPVEVRSFDGNNNDGQWSRFAPVGCSCRLAAIDAGRPVPCPVCAERLGLSAELIEAVREHVRLCLEREAGREEAL